MASEWVPDVLGGDFESCALQLPDDDEGPVIATLVRHLPRPAGSQTAGTFGETGVPAGAGTVRRPGCAGPGTPGQYGVILYIHGWSDYFFQRELADFWSAQQVAFYALDLRKHGRSLRPWQSAGYITDLAEYDADIDAALEAIEADLNRQAAPGEQAAGPAGPPRLTLMGHSTGGLIAALWAHRHPGRLRALILNSPWLELQGSSLVRSTTAALLEPVARRRPKAQLKLPELGFYWRSISNAGLGEWDLNPQWRPEFSFPIRAGWVRAVLAGHARVARGLQIQAPVLVLASARSVISTTWHESMLHSDSVLDVTRIAKRALGLGPRVSIYRYEGALHDVLLSAPAVRSLVYAQLRQWAAGFVTA